MNVKIDSYEKWQHPEPRYGSGAPAAVIIKLYWNGSINLSMGGDISAPGRSALARVAAAELGVPASAIQVNRAGNGDNWHLDPVAGGGMMPAGTQAVRNASLSLRAEMLAVAAEDLQVAEDELMYMDGEIIWTGNSRIRVRITELSRLHERGVMVGVGYLDANPIVPWTVSLLPVNMPRHFAAVPGKSNCPGL